MKKVGPRSRHREHLFTDELRALDIRLLHREGLVEREGSYPATVQWSGAGTSSITVVPKGIGVLLEYSVVDRSGSEQHSDLIVVHRTRCHFGGRRPWWLCPRCGRLCAILYGGRSFLCRRCHDLKYRSQSESKGERLLRKAERIRARLGGSGVVFDTFPTKPPGMHWQTFYRLRDDAEEAKVRGLALALSEIGSRRRRSWY